MSEQPSFSAELARIAKVMDRTQGELMERQALVTEKLESSVVPATPDAVSLGDLAYGDRSLHHGITPVSMRTRPDMNEPKKSSERPWAIWG